MRPGGACRHERLGRCAGAPITAARSVSIPAAPLMHATGCGWTGPLVAARGGHRGAAARARSLDAGRRLAIVERHRVTGLTIVVGDAWPTDHPGARRVATPAGPRGDDALLGDSRRSSASGVEGPPRSQARDRRRLRAVGAGRGSHRLVGGVMGTSDHRAGRAARRPLKPATATARGWSSMTTTRPSSPAPGWRVGWRGRRHDPPPLPQRSREDVGQHFGVIKGTGGSLPAIRRSWRRTALISCSDGGSGCINTGGEKVFPEEVEEAVKRVEGVRDCLVVGVENEKFGQAVTAVVFARGRLDGQLRNDHRLREAGPRRLQGAQVGDLVDHVPRARTARPTTAAQRSTPKPPPADPSREQVHELSTLLFTRTV